MDFKNMGAKRVCIVTDSNVAQLDAMKQATEGLAREGVEFTVFDKVRVEPKDSSYVLSSRTLKKVLNENSLTNGKFIELRKLLPLLSRIIQMHSLLLVSFNQIEL